MKGSQRKNGIVGISCDVLELCVFSFFLLLVRFKEYAVLVFSGTRWSEVPERERERGGVLRKTNL